MTKKFEILKAIRAHCLDCAAGRSAVRECTATACDLHPYRMGRDPDPSKSVGFGKRSAVAEASERDQGKHNETFASFEGGSDE